MNILRAQLASGADWDNNSGQKTHVSPGQYPRSLHLQQTVNVLSKYMPFLSLLLRVNYVLVYLSLFFYPSIILFFFFLKKNKESIYPFSTIQSLDRVTGGTKKILGKGNVTDCCPTIKFGIFYLLPCPLLLKINVTVQHVAALSSQDFFNALPPWG